MNCKQLEYEEPTNAQKPKDDLKSKSKEFTCFRCGQPNHKAWDCPKGIVLEDKTLKVNPKMKKDEKEPPVKEGKSDWTKLKSFTPKEPRQM